MSNSYLDLMVSHLVNCFNAYDTSAEFVFLDTFLQLALGLIRTKYQNGFRITNTRNDRIVVNIVVNVEMPHFLLYLAYLSIISP